MSLQMPSFLLSERLFYSIITALFLLWMSINFASCKVYSQVFIQAGIRMVENINLPMFTYVGMNKEYVKLHCIIQNNLKSSFYSFVCNRHGQFSFRICAHNQNSIFHGIHLHFSPFNESYTCFQRLDLRDC